MLTEDNMAMARRLFEEAFRDRRAGVGTAEKWPRYGVPALPLHDGQSGSPFQ